MNKNRWIIVAVVVIVILSAVGIWAKKKGWIGGSDQQLVAVENVSKRTIIETVTASGKITPQTEVKLSSEVSGEVIQLNVQEGDSVRKGQLLCVVNPAIYESIVTQATASVNQARASLASAKASLIQAKAAFENARRNYERNKKLRDEKVISELEYDASRLQYEQAEANQSTAEEQVNAAAYSVKSIEAQLKQAQDNLEKTKIFAPISGIVSLVNVKLGERVVGTAQMAGTEIIRIADLDNMQVEVDVNENDVLRISLGDTAEVEVDAYLNKKFVATVTQVSYSATNAITQIVSTSQATNFTVKLKLQKESYSELINAEIGRKFPFRPGMSATVDIKTEERANVLSVPIQAVTTRDDKEEKEKAEDAGANKGLKEIVFVVEGEKAVAKNVSTGIQDAGYIEITSGLTEKERVVKAPFKLISKTLKDGSKVKVVDEKELFKEKEEGE